MSLAKLGVTHIHIDKNIELSPFHWTSWGIHIHLNT